MKIVFFQRKPRKLGNYSIELYFENIRKHLPEFVKPVLFISKFESSGLVKRIFNIIHASFFQGEINHITGDVHFLNLLMKKRKTILTVHDCGFMNNPSPIKRKILKFFWLTFPSKKSAYITAISETTKDEILKYIKFDKNKIFVIPNLVCTHFIACPKRFNKDQVRILQLGTAHNKNIERLIDAIKGIKCEIIIVGGLNDKILQKLKSENINYTSLQGLTNQEILEQYNLCDIVSLISTYEGFGMPIIEANSVERAVITSNISSMPEVAQDAACLVDPYDIHSMREGFKKIINDDAYRNQIIENGRKNKLKYSPQVIVDSYVELYKKIYNESN